MSYRILLIIHEIVVLSSTKKIKFLKMYWVVGAYSLFTSKPTTRALLPACSAFVKKRHTWCYHSAVIQNNVSFFPCVTPLVRVSSLPNFVFWGYELGLYLEVILYTRIWCLKNDTVFHLSVPSENNPWA